jgi:hypothetical protein
LDDPGREGDLDMNAWTRTPMQKPAVRRPGFFKNLVYWIMELGRRSVSRGRRPADVEQAPLPDPVFT